MAAIDEVFEALFFGSGAWLGLLIFLTLSVSLVLMWKYAGFFVALIILMFEVEYYTRLDDYGNHVWKMIILLFVGLFIGAFSITKINKDR